MGERTPRYALPGPCVAWVTPGRDGRWYRVCVPCDTVIPPGGSLPAHLACGYAREGDAEMSVRDHVRQMARNRAAYAMALDRERRIMDAAGAGDILTFGREILRNPRWTPAPDADEAEQRRILADHVTRHENRGHRPQ